MGVDGEAAFSQAVERPLGCCGGAECDEWLCVRPGVFWVCALEGWGEGDEGADEARQRPELC